MNRLFLGLATAMFGAAVAYAGVPITYVFTQTATGTVGATPFTNATLTITINGNTGNVVFNGGPSVNYSNAFAANTAIVNISGVGSGTTSNSGSVNDNQAVFSGSVNFFDSGSGSGGTQFTVRDDLIASSALASYALASSIGPLGPQALGSWGPVQTSLGNLTVTSASNLTFQATASPATTPVPSSLYLCLIGLSGLAFFAAARRRVA